MAPTEAERPRTFNTEVRKPWNSVIHHSLKAIDLHTRFYLETGSIWHKNRAQFLREYVAELKDVILALEEHSEVSQELP